MNHHTPIIEKAIKKAAEEFLNEKNKHNDNNKEDYVIPKNKSA